MKLSVKERVILLGCMPPQGDVVTLKIIKDLIEKLGFTEEEIKKINLRKDDKEGTVYWDGEIEKEIEIGERAMDVITNSLTELNKQGKLSIEHLSVYERFVEKKEEES